MMEMLNARGHKQYPQTCITNLPLKLFLHYFIHSFALLRQGVMLLHSLMTCADHKLDMEYIQLIICLVRLFRKHPDTAEAEGEITGAHGGGGRLLCQGIMLLHSLMTCADHKLDISS